MWAACRFYMTSLEVQRLYFAPPRRFLFMSPRDHSVYGLFDSQEHVHVVMDGPQRCEHLEVAAQLVKKLPVWHKQLRQILPERRSDSLSGT